MKGVLSLGLFFLGVLFLNSCATGVRWIAVPTTFRNLETAGFFPRPIDPNTLEEQLVDLSGWSSEPGPGTRFRTALWARWSRALVPGQALGRQLVLWKNLAEESSSPIERYWADKAIYRLYKAANLNNEAATWLRAALKEFSYDRDWNRLAWLDVFEKTGPETEAKQAYWLGAKDEPGNEGVQRKMVRQTLFFRSVSLGLQGLDEHVSCLAADRDDLWIATWNGGLARLSTATGEWKVWLKPEATVSPIKTLAVTRWFVYVFRDSVLSRLSKVTETWKDFPLPPHWSGLRVQDVVAVDDENLFVAHLGQGFWQWNRGQWIDLSQRLPSKFLNAVAETEQGWWIGTQDQGGGLLPNDGSDFQPWPRGPTNVTFLLPVSEKLIVGSFGSGLWWGKPDELERLAGAPDYVVAGLLGPNLQKMVFWGGTLDEGAVRWDGRSFEKYSPEQGFSATDVTSLAVVGGKVWWGCNDAGLGVWTDDSP